MSKARIAVGFALAFIMGFLVGATVASAAEVTLPADATVIADRPIAHCLENPTRGVYKMMLSNGEGMYFKIGGFTILDHQDEPTFGPAVLIGVFKNGEEPRIYLNGAEVTTETLQEKYPDPCNLPGLSFPNLGEKA